ncbi:hypothetical protein Gohar_021413 [Gossypium harknessii]|uniref:Uncharacterized protein n=2 Tax=Gossypium TaxID=3633 RepID=A0A7J9C7X7_GOSGO|nr:hypothetical protein [Gossypium gossypioides]MBA0818460.1 hypothetical protein [Gossypium harknessii]
MLKFYKMVILGGSGFDPPRWFDEEKPTEE